MTVANRLLGLLLGAALLLLGTVTVVETLLSALGRTGWVIDRAAADTALTNLAWDDQGVVAGLVIAALVGLLLLAAQLKPARPVAYTLRDDADGRQTSVSRRGLQELLRRVAVDDCDVLHATVRAARRTVAVTVAVPPDADQRAVRQRVRASLDERLTGLDLARRMRPKVTVRRSKERVR